MSESGITESESKRIHERLPAVSRYFRLKSQIGSGTFSKVYLAEIKGLQESPTVAIKIITPTSDPARVYSHGIYLLNYFSKVSTNDERRFSYMSKITTEISILKRANGENNIIPLVSCFVNPDSGTAALVMPFVNHKPFSEYFNKLDLREIRLYIRGLLLSLRHLHALGILHRDIKPPNFLFDPISGQATLVDFGLSEEIKNRQHFPETPLKKNLNCTCTYQQVCKLCLTKQSIRASRAGTGGFRPPEVLLKYQQQDQKIDIWAAGVCLIILLSRRYPYFPAVEDSLALVHIASLLGKSSIMEVAVSLGKRLSFAGIPDPVHSLAETVHLQRKNSSRGVSSPSETASSEWRHVIDLLRSLLNPDPKKRPDASEALQMDFFLLYS